ncbi:MAG: hypothetical protein ACIRZZ_00415 [Lactobacillus gallinarum]
MVLKQFENIVERLDRKEILIVKKSESKQEKLEEKEAIKNWRRKKPLKIGIPDISEMSSCIFASMA